MILFAAAGDGTSALETQEGGLFTRAIYKTWSQVRPHPLTYGGTIPAIRHQVKALSYQIPYFHGKNLDTRLILGNGNRNRPICWRILSLEPLTIGGPPLPGSSKGAELRVYGDDAGISELRNPAAAKATLIVEKSFGLQAYARIDQLNQTHSLLKLGDLCVPRRPDDQSLRIALRIRPAAEPGGLSQKRAEQIITAINRNEETRAVVELGEKFGGFELIRSQVGSLQLLGPEGNVRNVFDEGPSMEGMSVSRRLWQHARNQALLLLEGEGGPYFEDHRTLAVSLVPAEIQDMGVSLSSWEQSPANALQVVPIGLNWNIRVSVDQSCPVPLVIGGIVLSSDGSLFGFPSDGSITTIKPGESHTLTGDTFTGGFPLDVEDQILVFGTREDQQIPWHRLTTTAQERTGADTSPLFRALDRFLNVGTRSSGITLARPENATWTLTSLPLRTQAKKVSDEINDLPR